MNANPANHALHLTAGLACVRSTAGGCVLALVSTGEGLREWIFYARSESSFMDKLNQGLRGGPRFPIEIHAAPDPTWTTYQTFKQGIRE